MATLSLVLYRFRLMQVKKGRTQKTAHTLGSFHTPGGARSMQQEIDGFLNYLRIGKTSPEEKEIRKDQPRFIVCEQRDSTRPYDNVVTGILRMDSGGLGGAVLKEKGYTRNEDGEITVEDDTNMKTLGRRTTLGKRHLFVFCYDKEQNVGVAVFLKRGKANPADLFTQVFNHYLLNKWPIDKRDRAPRLKLDRITHKEEAESAAKMVAKKLTLVRVEKDDNSASNELTDNAYTVELVYKFRGKRVSDAGKESYTHKWVAAAARLFRQDDTGYYFIDGQEYEQPVVEVEYDKEGGGTRKKKYGITEPREAGLLVYLDGEDYRYRNGRVNMKAVLERTLEEIADIHENPDIKIEAKLHFELRGLHEKIGWENNESNK